MCFEDSKPTLTHVIPAGNGSVSGLASLNDQLFVVRHGCRAVEVYDTTTFSLQRNIALNDASCLWGVASCPASKSIYVSDHTAHKIYKILITDSSAPTNWTVANNPIGLSVTNSHNVLVSSWAANKLQEFTPQGGLVREITLASGLTHPFHCISLDNSPDQYAVSWSTSGVPSQFHISLIRADGSVSHNDQTNSSSKMTKSGSLLSIDSNDNILMCEWQNNRVMVFNKTLTASRDLALPTATPLDQPFSLCFDESLGRLYVGEWRGERVFVYDDVVLENLV